MDTKNNVGKAIEDYIVAEILKGDGADLTWDLDLIRTGLIDSVTTVLLVDYLSKTFDVKIPMAETVADNLRSINTMVGLVTRLRTRSEQLDRGTE